MGQGIQHLFPSSNCIPCLSDAANYEEVKLPEDHLQVIVTAALILEEDEDADEHVVDVRVNGDENEYGHVLLGSQRREAFQEEQRI